MPQRGGEGQCDDREIHRDLEEPRLPVFDRGDDGGDQKGQQEKWLGPGEVEPGCPECPNREREQDPGAEENVGRGQIPLPEQGDASEHKRPEAEPLQDGPGACGMQECQAGVDDRYASRLPIPARDRVIPTLTPARGCMPTPVVTCGWRCEPMRRPIPGHARVIRGWGRPPVLARIPGWASGPVLSATRGLRRG